MQKIDPRIRILAAIMLFLMLSFFFLIIYNEEIFFRKEISFKVEENSVAHSCVSTYARGISRLFAHDRHRKPVPQGQGSFLHWCGAVLTNKGSYILPETSAINLLSAPRASLVAELKEGCTVEATITSTSGMPQMNERSRAPTRRKILKVHRVFDCGGAS